MNTLDPKKAKHLYALFGYGHGIRESSRLAGVNRGTSARHHIKWLAIRQELQRAYDALWDGDAETCDAINAPLPEPAVHAMLDAWLDDYTEDTTVPKSGFHAGFKPLAPKPNPLLTIRDQGRLAWYGWRSPVPPSGVTAAESLWMQWREHYVAECRAPQLCTQTER